AVHTASWTQPTLEFVVPPMGGLQAGWEALCRAIMQHPDFLFTRAPSTSTFNDAGERRRLQLVKIAQDLVARPPTVAEQQKVESGASLAEMIDSYLQTQEFKDFYFHRIRLYLESQGTESQDEPARLWCYITFNNRPFQEILTADYTVDSSWNKQP